MASENMGDVIVSLADANERITSDPQLQAVFSSESVADMERRVNALTDRQQLQTVLDVAHIIVQQGGGGADVAQVKRIQQAAAARQEALIVEMERGGQSGNKKVVENAHDNDVRVNNANQNYTTAYESTNYGTNSNGMYGAVTGDPTWVLFARPDAGPFHDALFVVAPAPPSGNAMNDIMQQIEQSPDEAALETLLTEIDSLLTKDDLSDDTRETLEALHDTASARLDVLASGDANKRIDSLLDAQSRIASDPALQAVFEADSEQEAIKRVGDLDDANQLETVIDVADVILESEDVADSEKQEVQAVRAAAVARQAELNAQAPSSPSSDESLGDKMSEFFNQEWLAGLSMWVWWLIIGGIILLFIAITVAVAATASKKGMLDSIYGSGGGSRSGW